MLPFDPITASSILLLAASNPDICKIPKPAEISVVPKTAELVIDTNRTFADIQHQEIDTINPYGYNSVTHTNGFMEGEIRLTAEVKLDYKQARGYRAFCLWYDKVTLNLEITPKIVIAKEVAQDRCMYKAVLEHEMKHVNVDRKVVNKYAKSIGAKVFEGLKARGFIVGPIAPENTESVTYRMRETVSQLVELEYKKLEIERAELQQAVDNLEEYQSVQAKCPRFRSPATSAYRGRR